MPRLIPIVLLQLIVSGGMLLADTPTVVEADLLVVGGTESGCAAAVQAARMGVKRVVLVNDIQWLGGQFSAEGLGAIDENRAHEYSGKTPIPRSGIFKEVIDAIETKNSELYGGVRRPGNTRVITTVRPVVAEQVFRELLAPYEKSGRVKRYSDYFVDSVITEKQRVLGVVFQSSKNDSKLVVRAPITIDASDWGDVIQGSGARWFAGPDARSEYDEPSAPTSNEPKTDMNPITWCMILKQQPRETLIPKPPGYDARYFNGTWGWIDEKFAYTSRRLVDGEGFDEIDHPDVLLINSPPIDYPVDAYSADVAAALEKDERGASTKNIVAMSRRQREIVFRNARQHSLKFLYHLQQSFPKFRRMALSDEFGTANQLPPKPYIRESLRLAAQHIVREQEVLGFGGRSNYAAAMFPDAVFCWQFELDFHPTRRSFTTDLKEKGPWEADFRGNRRFGRGGTGRCVFPLRALVPEHTAGLLAAQKNLGYTSIVGSSCRLHDQSIHVGQASGCIAAISLRHGEDPSTFYANRERLAEIWSALLEPEAGAPLVIWPLADVEPTDPGFAAIQHLALRRLLNFGPTDTAFKPDEPADEPWLSELLAGARNAGYKVEAWKPQPDATRRDVAVQLWKQISALPIPPIERQQADDADGDGVVDSLDPLPFTSGVVSWKLPPDRDGLPEPFDASAKSVVAIDFTSARAAKSTGFQPDIGERFSDDRGYGWLGDLTANTRLRNTDSQSLRDGFVFTRVRDVWECRVENGKWNVQICLGDAGHEQPGQHLAVEGESVAANATTAAGQYREYHHQATVRDGRLTLTIGTAQGGSNTCLNWVVVTPIED